MASNQQSQFAKFSLRVTSTTETTGIACIPKFKASSAEHRPLLVLIHGATCTAHHFDVSSRLTASIMADSLSVPVVAINRPGYLDSTPLSIAEGSSFHQEHGKFYHEFLFPRLWKQFGEPNHCTAVVVMAHSIGSMGAIVAAGLYSEDEEPTYPWVGLIYSGLGIRHATGLSPPPSAPAEKLTWKREMMCGKPHLALAPTEAVDRIAVQDHPIAHREREDLVNGAWNRYWRHFAGKVSIPIMFGQAEHDFFWEGSAQQVEEVTACFPKCPRFDGGVVSGTPHAIEWSHCSHGWYARCFGFALEVTAAQALTAR